MKIVEREREREIEDFFFFGDMCLLSNISIRWHLLFGMFFLLGKT